MGYTIAIAGKGGTGKTTIAALLVRLIKEKKLGSILAVDADPNNNLAENLGVKIKETIGQILDDVLAHADKIPAGMTKDRFIEYRIQTAVVEAGGFDLLTMGKPEGPGCYCYANNVLRDIISKLIKDYDYIIIDNEAGLEHLSRRTTRNADALVVISDGTVVGLKSAQRIVDLVEELDIKAPRRFLIINRYGGDLPQEKTSGLKLEYLGNIPEDNALVEASLNGGSLQKIKDQAVSLTTLRKIWQKIWQAN